MATVNTTRPFDDTQLWMENADQVDPAPWITLEPLAVTADQDDGDWVMFVQAG